MARKRKISLKKSWPVIFPLAFVLAAAVLLVSARQLITRKDCGCGRMDASVTGEFDSQEKVAYFNNLSVDYPGRELSRIALESLPGSEYVLGVSDDDRWVEIDLSEQTLYAREGEKVAFQFLISSGKPWTPTVTGEFRIWAKIKYAKMSGGSRSLGNYYYLPNVPFIQYFHGDYGLHGAYWHNNFGQTMSHGCVNISIPDAERLFYWTRPVVPAGKGTVFASNDNPGTRVVVHE